MKPQRSWAGQRNGVGIEGHGAHRVQPVKRTEETVQVRVVSGPDERNDTGVCRDLRIDTRRTYQLLAYRMAVQPAAPHIDGDSQRIVGDNVVEAPERVAHDLEAAALADRGAQPFCTVYGGANSLRAGLE